MSYDYESFEQQFDPMRLDRQARRKRKPKARHIAKKSQNDILDSIADSRSGIEFGFTMSYQPSLHEAGWLSQSLRGLYEQELITDVLAIVKGGKEANVYRCLAHPNTGQHFLAAKVYRPHMFRKMRDDQVYREGRMTLTPEGKAAKQTDQRIMRALHKKSEFGRQVAHTSWLMYEYSTLQALYRAGAAVPKVYSATENAVLMDYIGNDAIAAPTLSEVGLEPDEAVTLFDQVLHNIEIMLEHHLIHGDLSAYNILYWEGSITMIDFPQVTDVFANNNAYMILKRDLQRLCEYFARQGVKRHAQALLDDLWGTYGAPPPEPLLFDDFTDDDEDR